jgi:hypothetical protein
MCKRAFQQCRFHLQLQRNVSKKLHRESAYQRYEILAIRKTFAKWIAVKDFVAILSAYRKAARVLVKIDRVYRVGVHGIEPGRE